MIAALQYDMRAINGLINNLDAQQKESISALVLEEVLHSATKYISIDPILGASTLISLMRMVGYRLPPKDMERAIASFPAEYSHATLRERA